MRVSLAFAAVIGCLFAISGVRADGYDGYGGYGKGDYMEDVKTIHMPYPVPVASGYGAGIGAGYGGGLGGGLFGGELLPLLFLFFLLMALGNNGSNGLFGK